MTEAPPRAASFDRDAASVLLGAARPEGAPDPRQRYRLAFDAAAERGEVDDRKIAKGKCKAWNAYLRGAELCERSPEEWQLEHVYVGYHGHREHQRQAHTQLRRDGTVTIGWGRGGGKTFFACRELFDAARTRPGGIYMHVGASSDHAWHQLMMNVAAEPIACRPTGRALPAVSGDRRRVLMFDNGSSIEVVGHRRPDHHLRGYRLAGVAYDERPDISPAVIQTLEAGLERGDGFRIVVDDSHFVRGLRADLVHGAFMQLGIPPDRGLADRAARFIANWPIPGPPCTQTQVVAWLATFLMLENELHYRSAAERERSQWHDALPPRLVLYAGGREIRIEPSREPLAPDSAIIRGDRMTEHALLRGLSIANVEQAVNEFRGRWADEARLVMVHPQLWASLNAEAAAMRRYDG